MKLHTILRAPCILLLGAFALHAEVPSLINFQGRLADAQGNTVTGNRTMAVRVYDAPSGGNMTYEENIGTVEVANGTYNFRFGSGGAGVVEVLTGSDYLALSVNGTEESTRTRLLAVPYALKSADAQALHAELVRLGVIRTLSGTMIAVQGGTLSSFEIGKYEVTWEDWHQVRTWAVVNGYSDLAGVGRGSAEDHPVRNVSWYDVVKYCNALSEREGLVPVYRVSGEVYRSGESAPTLQSGANGYRLPTEAEWEWAARGGVSSQGYTYSGSNDVNAVAWYRDNSNGAALNLSFTIDYITGLIDSKGTWPVGLKGANELGIHDMSGNVLEWCEDLTFGFYRRTRGGSWSNDAGSAAVTGGGNGFSGARVDQVGFRLARSSGL